MNEDPDRLPPPPFWRTRYFANSVMARPDRRGLDMMDIARVLAAPVRRQRQADGRVRYWGWSSTANGWLRVVTLADAETVHNAFLDQDFEP